MYLKSRAAVGIVLSSSIPYGNPYIIPIPTAALYISDCVNCVKDICLELHMHFYFTSKTVGTTVTLFLLECMFGVFCR